MTDSQKLSDLDRTVREVVRLLGTAERGAEYLVSAAKTRLSDAIGRINGSENKSLLFYYGDKGKCLFADTPFTVRKFKVKETSYGRWAAFKKSGSRYEEIGSGGTLESAESICLEHYQQSK